MAATGIKARFQLGTVSTPTTLVDLTALLAVTNIEPDDDTEEVDATPIQPDTAQPTRSFIPSFQTSGVTLTFNWAPAVQEAVDAIRGGVDLDYEYGPEGNASGQTVLEGTANVTHAGQVPGSSPDAVNQITVRVRFNSVTTSVVV